MVASNMLGISRISPGQTNYTINTNIDINNSSNATNGNRTLSAIFNITSSSSSPTALDASLNLSSMSNFTQSTNQNFMNWSSNRAGHESSLGRTTSLANVNPIFDVAPAPFTAIPLSMRVVSPTKMTSSPLQSTPESTWDSSVLIAASLFILALSLVAIALRILVPIYYHIMGHNESKEPRERHFPDRDPHRQPEIRDRRERHERHERGERGEFEMSTTTTSEEILIPFGTPATHMRPAMNYDHLCSYQYPLTYLSYQGPMMWSPQAYEQDCIINQPIPPDIPPQKASSGHQADRLVEILDYPSDQLNMGALYRHNWDQLFDGVANESMLSYVGHPSEYRLVPAAYNPKP